MKKTFLLSTFLVMILILLGCGGETTTTGTIIKIWAPQEEQALLIDLTQVFIEDHPQFDITFEYAIMGVEASITAIKTDNEAAADVFMYPSGGVPELTAAGLILPITLHADELIAEHSTNSIDSVTKDGLLYGVPMTPNSFFMYYDKSLYTEEEVLSLDTMMAKDLGEGVYNFSTNLDDSWYLPAFFFAAGCTLFGSDGLDSNSFTFNNTQGMLAGEYLIDLVNNPKYIDDESGLAGSLMAEGKLGAYTSGTWAANTIKAALGDNYGATKLPSITLNGQEKQLSSFVDYKVFGVNSATQHPEEAIEVAIWLGSATAQMLRFETNNDAPTITSLLNHPQVMANIEVGALLAQEPLSTKQPLNSKLSDFWTPVQAFGAELLSGAVTQQTLQQKLDEMVNGVLQ